MRPRSRENSRDAFRPSFVLSEAKADDEVFWQVLQEKYHAMREDEATKDAPEIEVFGTLST